MERIIQTAGSVKGCPAMARVNSNIYAEMIVKLRKLWFSFWWLTVRIKDIRNVWKNVKEKTGRGIFHEEF